MSGGSFNYLFDREAKELTDRTLELQEMGEYLREFLYETEARETEALIGKINRFHDELEARAKDLRPVWKAAEWFRSNDWDRAALSGAVQDHHARHPEGSIIPGLERLEPPQYWGIVAGAQTVDVAALTAPKWATAPEDRKPRPPRTPDPEPLTRPESLDDDDYRWAEDQDRWAVEFTREELLWIAAAANDAIRTQDEAAEESRRRAEEDARWDARRAELIEQFNGGPIQIGGGQPIPTMALKAVEYIIETERNAEKGNA